MPDNLPREDNNHFQIALIVGGIVFAIALGVAIWVKQGQQAPAQIDPPAASATL